MSGAKKVAKWGFGMAPVSSRMRKRYDDAVQTALDFIGGNLLLEEINLDHVSELKGMFNRCLRKDQWDWFTVFTELGEPDRKYSRQIVNALTRFRKAAKENNCHEAEGSKRQLIRSNLVTYLYAYQGNLNNYADNTDYGWVYILSTREQPDVLKIGMTKRSVDQRVKEINSATGVPIPFAARKVFRVSNAAAAERAVFEQLQVYRIRPDREFFKLPFKEAVAVIEACLDRISLYQREQGSIIWFDRQKQYGFISSEKKRDIFLHISQVNNDDVDRLVPGMPVEFEVGYGPQGPLALSARLVDTNAC